MTSPSTDFSAYRIIREAGIESGFASAGDDMDSETMARFFDRLVSICMLWQIDGLRLWLQEDLSVTLVAGTATYTLLQNTQKPTRVLDSCYYLDSSSTKRPLIMISRDDYARLSNTTVQGAINSYFIDKQASTLTATYWLTPDAQAATGTAHMLIQQQQPTPVMLTDIMSLPREWELGLIWALADEMSGSSPTAVQTRCAAKAMDYKTRLDNWDVEDASTLFAPDPRSNFAYGGRR